MIGVCVGAAADAGPGLPVADAGSLVPVADVVINEIAAKGAEFIELFNGSAAFDVSNYSVADSESDGGPKYSEAIHFPSGTVIANRGFLVVVTSQKDAGVTSTCPAGVSTCFAATFSISSSRGETVWLLDPKNQVVDSKHYPIGAADAGSSYGRIPNGAETWGVVTPSTPGASN
jgi:hypothetical protein